jgi:hypothetical protein
MAPWPLAAPATVSPMSNARFPGHFRVSRVGLAVDQPACAVGEVLVVGDGAVV